MLACLVSMGNAGREIYWNLPSPYNQVALYACLAVSLIILGNGIFWRLKLWLKGRSDHSRSGAWLTRTDILFREVLFQRNVNRERVPRLFHTLIFFGFLVLLFTTTMVFIHQDLGIKIYQGRFYLATTILSDLFGLLLLVGVFLAFYRRYIVKPDFLHNTRTDFFMLFLLAALVVQGFLLEGLRVAVTSDPWGWYSPVGYLVGEMFWGLSPWAMKTIHFITWWIHSLSVFLFIALLPYTKFFHVLASSMNLFFADVRRKKGAMRYPGNIETLLENAAEGDGEFSIGAKTISDLTWKQRLDLDACTSCGRCQAVCPAYNSGKMLSPKWLILDTRNHLLSLHAAGKKTTADELDTAQNIFKATDQILLDSALLQPIIGAGEFRGKNPLIQEGPLSLGNSSEDSLAGEVLHPDVFWACTTCYACVEACPVGIGHVDYIMDVRRSMALVDGVLPQESQSSLRSMESRGNPFGDPNERLSWAKDLEIPLLEPGMEVDVLYWVGCVSAFDKRKQQIARSMVKILNASGLRWGMLGTKENCTGDPARRLGEENLYQSLAKKNIELLSQITFHTMVANCPHCFHTMNKEYPDLGDLKNGREVRIIHHSHLIEELLEKKSIILKEPLRKDITYHDPCYLGRYNNTYNEPREILVQLGKKQPLEMASHKEKSLCCGAGGGHYFFDMKVGERVNVLRVNQAAETEAELIATACPFCMQMLEDGLKLTDRDSTMEVRDIAELVAAAI